MESKHLFLRVKTFTDGKYMQTLKYLIHEETGVYAIQDALCTCRYGTIYPNNWAIGKNVCRHIREILIKIKEKNERLEKR